MKQEVIFAQGGMMATLSYLNFLPDVVQRSAVSTAAAMAAQTTSDTMPFALEALPYLLALLDDCKDTQILNSACLALDHITKAAARCEVVMAGVTNCISPTCFHWRHV